MSLMKTLAKVAIGVAVAKGASAMMNKNKSSAGGSGGGLGGLLGGLSGGSGSQNASSTGGGGLQDMLGGLMGGSSGGSGGLGGLLNQLGGSSRGSSGGGLGGLLGGLAGAAGAGGLMAGMKGGSDSQSQPQREEADFGAVLNSQFDSNPTPAIEPSQDQEAIAALMIKAMIQAAKSDGRIDDAEKQRLLGHLGDSLDDDERQFIREQMAAPVDARALAGEVPKGLEAQVYLMSLLAIDFDNEDEARYLRDLAQAMGLSREAVNGIHAEAGATPLYT